MKVSSSLELFSDHTKLSSGADTESIKSTAKLSKSAKLSVNTLATKSCTGPVVGIRRVAGGGGSGGVVVVV